MLWSEIMSGQFEDAVKKANGVCAIVVGCVEQHGHHLPMGQDVIFTEGIAIRATKKEPFVIFPSMYFGEKTGAGEFPGTIIFSAKLRFDMLKESCDEIARNGNSERIGHTVVSYAADKLASDIKVLKEDTACEAYLTEWLSKQR